MTKVVQMPKEHNYELTPEEKEKFEIAKTFDDPNTCGPKDESWARENHYEDYTQVKYDDENGKEVRIEDHSTIRGGIPTHEPHVHHP